MWPLGQYMCTFSAQHLWMACRCSYKHVVIHMYVWDYTPLEWTVHYITQKTHTKCLVSHQCGQDYYELRQTPKLKTALPCHKNALSLLWANRLPVSQALATIPAKVVLLTLLRIRVLHLLMMHSLFFLRTLQHKLHTLSWPCECSHAFLAFSGNQYLPHKELMNEMPYPVKQHTCPVVWGIATHNTSIYLFLPC